MSQYAITLAGKSTRESTRPSLGERRVSQLSLSSRTTKCNITVHNLIVRLRASGSFGVYTGMLRGHLEDEQDLSRSVFGVGAFASGGSTESDVYESGQFDVFIGASSAKAPELHIYNDGTFGAFVGLGRTSIARLESVSNVDFGAGIGFKAGEVDTLYPLSDGSFGVEVDISVQAQPENHINADFYDGVFVGANADLSCDVTLGAAVFGVEADMDVGLVRIGRYVTIPEHDEKNLSDMDGAKIADLDYIEL